MNKQNFNCWEIRYKNNKSTPDDDTIKKIISVMVMAVLLCFTLDLITYCNPFHELLSDNSTYYFMFYFILSVHMAE